MAGIETYLEQIKNAIYGKDVRQAIHDGIEECYKDGKAGAVDLVARQQIAELVAPSGEAPSAAEVTDARVGADGAVYNSLGDAIRMQVDNVNETLKNVPLSSLQLIDDSNYPLELVERLDDKYPSGSVGSNISFPTAANYVTNKYRIPVGISNVYPSAYTINTFGRVTDINGKILASGANCNIDMPEGSCYLYISGNKTTIPRVLDDDIFWVKNTSKYKYATENSLYSEEYKEYYHNLIKPVSYEELCSNPTSILTERDVSYANSHITLNRNTWGIINFFNNSSNLICELQVDCNSVVGATARIMYHSSADDSTHNASAIVSLVDGINNITLQCDCASLIQYNNADNFTIMFAGTSGTIIVERLKVYEQNNLVTYPYYSDDFSTMMVNVFSALAETDDIILTSPNGAHYKLIVADDGTLSTVRDRTGEPPTNLLIMGNSLVFGFHNATNTERFGMAATRAQYDYANRLIAYTEDKNPNLEYNKLYSSPFEHADTIAAANQFMIDNNSYWNSSVDMVIVQMGDNVNTDEKRAVFADSFPTLIAKIKSQCPSAVIVIVGIWFNRLTVFNIMKDTATQNNCIFVDIRGIRNSETEGELGATVYFEDGTTTTVTEGRVTHPGDLGMEKIAEAIEAKLGY